MNFKTIDRLGIEISQDASAEITDSTWTLSKRALSIEGGRAVVKGNSAIEGGDTAFDLQSGSLSLANVRIEDVPVGIRRWQ